MKLFNLKALGDKIKANISNKYDSILNKIAIKSKAYKNLYNEYNSFLITNKTCKLLNKESVKTIFIFQ